VDLRSVFARQLRSLRSEKGLTQAELADGCGRSIDMISRLERAAISPSLETVEVIADALDVDASELLGGAPAHPTPKDKRLKRLISLLWSSNAEQLLQIERVLKALQ